MAAGGIDAAIANTARKITLTLLNAIDETPRRNIGNPRSVPEPKKTPDQRPVQRFEKNSSSSRLENQKKFRKCANQPGPSLSPGNMPPVRMPVVCLPWSRRSAWAVKHERTQAMHI
jgi:hypothetical protein